MKKKTYKISTFISAIVWAIFTGIVWYKGESVGTIATLGGIALMFAWLYEQANLEE